MTIINTLVTVVYIIKKQNSNYHCSIKKMIIKLYNFEMEQSSRLVFLKYSYGIIYYNNFSL